MTLQEFRDRVARQSGMSTAASEDLALIDGWVNEGVEQFLRETKVNTILTSLAVTAGTDDYDLDSDILFMEAMWYEPADAQSAMLHRRSPEQLTEMRLVSNTAGTQPRYYAIAGARTLMLYPAPLSSSDVIHALYGPKASVMAASADTPSATAYGNIPSEYHTYVEAYAKWKACEAEEHKPSQYGTKFQQDYDQGVIKVKIELVRKTGPIMSPVHVGRPRPGVPLGNGVDWR